MHDAYIPNLPRINDNALMDYIIQLGLSTSQLTVLNACRCYLQVITLADTVTADGIKIIRRAKLGIKH